MASSVLEEDGGTRIGSGGRHGKGEIPRFWGMFIATAAGRGYLSLYRQRGVRRSVDQDPGTDTNDGRSVTR